MIIGHIRHIYITLSVVRIYVTTTTRGRKVKPCGQMQTKRKVLPGVIVLHSLISYVDTKSVLSYDCCILCKIRNILRRDSRIPIVYLTLICKMTHLPWSLFVWWRLLLCCTSFVFLTFYVTFYLLNEFFKGYNSMTRISELRLIKEYQRITLH